MGGLTVIVWAMVFVDGWPITRAISGLSNRCEWMLKDHTIKLQCQSLPDSGWLCIGERG